LQSFMFIRRTVHRRALVLGNACMFKNVHVTPVLEMWHV
jgi:hypothetical protein